MKLVLDGNISRNIMFRQLEAQDAPAFYALVNEIRDEGPYLYSTRRFTLEQTKDYLEKHRMTAQPIWGAFDEELLAGWIDYNRGDFPEVDHIAVLGMGVRREYRGRGLGKMLMRKALESARSAGIEKIELEVFSGNTGALNLYLQQGFTVEGRRRHGRKYAGSYEDVVLMARFILPGN
jgi:ribosomal protein S18 acetylase RimI-like enzyme